MNIRKSIDKSKCKTTLMTINGNTKKGMDPVFKCSICGKFISYDDIPNKVKVEFTPDTEYTIETTIFTHSRCL